MQEKALDVTVTQVKRHRKKPRVEISLSRVKKMIRDSKIKIKSDHAYIIYTCGHIFDYQEDPCRVLYNAGAKRGVRVCPVCVSEALLTKYKKCSCGAEHVGKHIQASKCCASCTSSRRASKGKLTENQKRKNSHLADTSRALCIHRDKCLKKYYMYDAIPCKGCKKYQESSIYIKD